MKIKCPDNVSCQNLYGDEVIPVLHISAPKELNISNKFPHNYEVNKLVNFFIFA